MLPASLQLKLKILQREVDSFTTMLLDPDIGDDNRLVRLLLCLLLQVIILVILQEND